MPSKREILQLKYVNHTSDIIRQPIIIVSTPRFVRQAETSTVYSNASVPHLWQLIKLIFKQIMVSWPAMDKQDCLVARRVKILNIDFYIRFNADIKPHTNTPIKKISQSTDYSPGNEYVILQVKKLTALMVISFFIYILLHTCTNLPAARAGDADIAKEKTKSAIDGWSY
jgi:hypothetical protein